MIDNKPVYNIKNLFAGIYIQMHLNVTKSISGFFWKLRDLFHLALYAIFKQKVFSINSFSLKCNYSSVSDKFEDKIKSFCSTQCK